MSDVSRKRVASETIGNSENEAKKLKKDLLPILAAHGSRKGERADMQDTHVFIPRFCINPEENQFLKRCSFFAIFDGHAGPRAAEYCQNYMPKKIRKILKKYTDFGQLTKTLKSSFVEAYKSIDDEFLTLAKSNKPFWKDGTTATTMIILDNVVYVANIGDSKVVVARKRADGTLTPVCLTVDHNPMAHEERMRIQKCGAVVKDGRINGVIEVSRSIGDASFKSAGIINTPDLKKLTLTENDLFAIIACDGLWKSFNNLEAIKFADEALEKAKKLDLQPEINETRKECELRHVAEKLAAEAVRRKCGDNVSVIIVKMNIV